MITKEAIAVYNPQDPIEAAFQDAYHGISGRNLTMGECKLVKRCLPLYRGLVQKAVTNPQLVGKLLFGKTNTSQYWYYPCDIVELRTVLSERQLSWHAPIVLFSPEAARKLLPEYPVCLVFDRKIEKEGRVFGSIVMRDSNRLNMGGNLKRIMIRDYLNEQQANTIYTIIDEAMGHVPSYLMTDVPFLKQKVASTGGEKMSNWYNRIKSAAGPAETFGKEFLIGKQPQIPDPDEMHTQYEVPHKALSLKKGDRVAFRYDTLQLPDWSKTRTLPVQRSLVNPPKAGTIQRIDEEFIYVQWDGAGEPQKVPLDAELFLVKLGDE